MRLRRSDCAGEGVRRRRAGRGFVFLDASGKRIVDEDVVDRLRELAIPPAWEEVWICPHPNGHIQATGIDDAGRKQYLYHPDWTRRRAEAKFDAMIEFARLLPRLRRAVVRDLDPGDAGKESVSAAAVRLLDLGRFRVGGEQYAEENETFGVATILRGQVSLPDDGLLCFEYPAKGDKERNLSLRDPAVRGLAEKLQRRRSGPADFLVYKASGRWVDLRSDDVNAYIQEKIGAGFSAKDFRTWSGTVIAAAYLGRVGEATSRRAREKRIREAIDAVADELGNTAAVAKGSYVDPRVFDRYRDGETIDASSRGRPALRGLSATERAVLALIDD